MVDVPMMTAVLLALSCSGFVVALGVHVAAGIGALPSTGFLLGLMVGGVVAVLPAHYGHPNHERVLDYRFLGPTLGEYPRWLKLFLGALLTYMLCFLFVRDLPPRWNIGRDPLSPATAQAGAIVAAWLYAFSGALLFDKKRRT